MNKMTRLLIASLLVFVGAAYADPDDDYKRSVKKINEEIANLGKQLNSKTSRLKTAKDDLLKTEREINRTQVDIASTRKKIADSKALSKDLEKQLAAASVNKKANQWALKKLLENRYKNGSSNYLKLLLNQENPYAIGRINNYNQYFSTAMQQQISLINAEIESSQNLYREQQENLALLDQEQQSLVNQEAKLAKSKSDRSKVVSTLGQSVEKTGARLKSLKADRARLNTLLQQIADQAKRLRLAEEKRRQEQAKQQQAKGAKPVLRKPVVGGFIKQKGRLNFPSTAKQTQSYGQRVAASGMVSNGIFFSTKASQKVHAIFRGRVLFADFLKGYGLLLIVDHGDDHISLYGHNEVLYKSVGDAVETDELISRSGVTGGLRNPGLYFEIRKNASPIDPTKWCRR